LLQRAIIGQDRHIVAGQIEGGSTRQALHDIGGAFTATRFKPLTQHAGRRGDADNQAVGIKPPQIRQDGAGNIHHHLNTGTEIIVYRARYAVKQTMRRPGQGESTARLLGLEGGFIQRDIILAAEIRRPRHHAARETDGGIRP